jgi:hypothetical protein
MTNKTERLDMVFQLSRRIEVDSGQGQAPFVIMSAPLKKLLPD